MKEVIIKECDDWYEAYIDGKKHSLEGLQNIKDYPTSRMYVDFWEDEWIEIATQVFFDQWSFVTGSELDKKLFEFFDLHRRNRRILEQDNLRSLVHDHILIRNFQNNYDQHDG